LVCFLLKKPNGIPGPSFGRPGMTLLFMTWPFAKIALRTQRTPGWQGCWNGNVSEKCSAHAATRMWQVHVLAEGRLLAFYEKEG